MCGGGPDTVTSTTTTAPPSWAVPHLQGAMNQSGISQGVGEEFFRRFNFPEGTGTDVATAEGLSAMYQRGRDGSQALGDANQLTQNTLQGQFLSPDTNPYLEQTFNRAADLTRGRLGTEFAGAGRNLGASMPARSEELQTLSSNIYGGNYQAERDRQANAVGNVQGLQNMDFQNTQAMIDAGSFNLDQYINRLAGLIPGAGGVTQATQPVFRTGLI